jgi:hypothetical protein
MERSIEAQVIDSHHLRLKKAIKIAPGSTVIITIEPDDVISENREWYLLSAQNLEKAYSNEEPEYPLETIKIPNPDFRP